MKLLALLLATVVAVQSLSDEDQWRDFKSKHVKIYKNHIDEMNRFAIFQSNLRRIEDHNKKEAAGLYTFKLGVTKFADLTPKEFQDMMNLSKQHKSKQNGIKYNYGIIGDLPNEVDWRKEGAVTEVKDQAACGSCWSFSATGTAEGANFLKTGKLVSLSEQNLVDCDSDCFGCGGGYMTKALDYMIQNGIMAENEYPYEAVNDVCRFNSSDIAVKVSSYYQIKSGDESDLQKSVALIGPVSVAIDASDYFQLYSSGILDDPSCGNTEDRLDHGVLAVGYGTKDGKDYWIVKNSWGTSWGMEGYVLMSRNKNNQCGIATDAVVALMK